MLLRTSLAVALTSASTARKVLIAVPGCKIVQKSGGKCLIGLRKILCCRRGTGLTILSGPTGTGKTTYLRSLVRRLTGMSTHCFYYIPTSFVGVLTSPEYVNFWVAQNQYQQHLREVAILEDAEELRFPKRGDGGT